MADEIDEGMSDTALMREAERQRLEVAGAWSEVVGSFRQRNPFAQMILSFRAGAIDAMASLIFVETKDPNVLRLQSEIQRYVATIDVIYKLREGAKAIDANVAADVSEDEQTFINTLIEDDYE